MELFRKAENLSQFPGEYISCGTKEGVEILRFKHPDGSLSGVIFKTDGKLMTARHVVEAHNLSGFSAHEGTHLDMAFKDDPTSIGPKLGYVDRMIVDGVKVVTSTVEEPDKLKAVPGRTSIYFMPTLLRPFQPDKVEDYELFKPGASGSPIIYKDHIIGLVPFSNVHMQGVREVEVAAVVFNGETMRCAAEEFGLKLEKVE